jgi:hypothetical protein
MIGYDNRKPEDKLRIASSLHYVNTIEELAAFRMWLVEELTNLDAQNRHETDLPMLYRRQGAAQTINQILIMAEKSRQTAEEIRKNNVRS